MAATQGFDKARKRLNDLSDRLLTPRECLQAIGRTARRAHVNYFKGAGALGSSGGGPPGEPWPGLEPKTIKRKLKKKETQKLVTSRGILKNSYAYQVRDRVMELRNTAKHAYFLQSGIGKAKKKFIVVAVDPEKHDPALWSKIKAIAQKWIMQGRTE